MNDALNTGISEEKDGFERLRTAILAEMLTIAPFDGWTQQALSVAAGEAGADDSALKAALPGGVSDILRLWSERLDAAMRAAMSGPEFEAMKIREKVAFAVRARLSAMRGHKEAARRAAATMALPPYGLLGARLAWKTADAIWRGLGDESTDFNYYSKRGVLTGVWTSTLMRWLADDSEDGRETDDFLDARIENVMQFEKAKARMRKANLDPEKAVSWLAKRRYGA